MLGSCETLTSKTFSTSDAVAGFSSLLSLALLFFLLPFSRFGTPSGTLFFQVPQARKRITRRLYRLHASFLI